MNRTSVGGVRTFGARLRRGLSICPRFCAVFIIAFPDTCFGEGGALQNAEGANGVPDEGPIKHNTASRQCMLVLSAALTTPGLPFALHALRQTTLSGATVEGFNDECFAT